MSTDDAAADRKTEATTGLPLCAWFVHLYEAVEHHFEFFGRDAHALVADAEDRLTIARFGLEPDPSNTGYGHDADEVAAVRPESADALLEYLDAVDARTRRMLDVVTPDDLDRIVDRRWTPPVTLGVRLVSVADDCLQHAGQAAYVRGLLDR